MKKNTLFLTSLKTLSVFLFIILGLLLSGNFKQAFTDISSETAPAHKLFTPTKEQSKITRELVKKLKKSHYLNEPIDNVFSEKVFDNYIKLLDPARAHFLATDIQEFSKYRDSFDDDLNNGNLETAFYIYRRYHQRRKQRLDYTLELLNKGIDSLDFNKNEFLELDRENLPWHADIDAARDLWRRLLKNDILNLKLDDDSVEVETGKVKVDLKTIRKEDLEKVYVIPPVQNEELNKKPVDTPDQNEEINQKPVDTPEDSIISSLTKRYQNQVRLLEQTNGEDVFKYFINAYTHSYDPHTEYFPPAESENFDIHMSLSLEGIGALLQSDEDGYVKVVRLIAAGPAERGKELQPADRIIAVGQGEKGELVDVEGWRLDDVVELIRGPKDSVVRLKVIPADNTDTSKTKIVSITRDTVKLEEQSAKKSIIELKRGEALYKIGVIKLPAFYVDFEAAMSGDPDYRSSTRDVEKLINELISENIDSLIIDLRNNGGGSLQEADDMTGLFIPIGPVVQIRDSENKTMLIRDLDPKMVYGGPMAVLVNRLSASASEIFAGAIQDYGRGIVIGSQTYGKGTVQSMERLDPGRLKYTQAKYYRVNGESTQNKGVIPDIAFPSIIDHDEIGESSLPQTMAWDRIAPANYQNMAILPPILDSLEKQHQKRISENPDFIYLMERVKFLEENRKKNSASLNESERRKERELIEQRLLAMENRRREALGKEQYKDYSEMESAEEEEDDDSQEDSLLKETGEILTDWLTIRESPQIHAQNLQSSNRE